MSDALENRTIMDAHSPFNDLHADVILRSSDSVDFRVRKAFLSYASPFFEGMFALPQSTASIEGQDLIRDGLTVVPMQESSATIYPTLTFCYPPGTTDLNPVETLKSLVEVLKMTRKYNMDGAEKEAGRVLIAKFAEKEALRVFTIAYSLGLETEARRTARYMLRVPFLGEHIAELDTITGSTYHRLQEYHRKCGQSANAVATNLSWLTDDSFVWFGCADCRHQCLNNNLAVTISDNRQKWVYSMWWINYMREVSETLKDRPSGETVHSPALVDEALKKACLCSTCRARAFPDMRKFCAILAAEVDRTTTEIELEIKF